MKLTNSLLLLLTIFASNSKYLLAQENNQVDRIDSSVYVKSYYVTPKDRSSFQSARLPLRDIENPQVSTNIDSRLLFNRNVYTQGAILSNATGISAGWASVSPYYNLRGFNVRSYIRNGVGAYASSELDPANIEAITVVKGPSGTLFGSTLVSFGGLINRITKKPIDSTFTEIGFAAGAYGYFRVNTDINTHLDKEHRMLFRFNGAYTDQSSFQDAGFSRVAFAAPSFRYRINDKLRIELEAEIQYRRGTSNSQIAPLNPSENGISKNIDNSSKLFLDYKKSYSNNSIYLNNPTINLYGNIQYSLAKNWFMETNLVNTWSENTGNFLYMGLINGDSSLVRKVTNYPDGSFRTQEIQQNIIGDFLIGGIRNRIVIGFDYYSNSSNTASNGLNGTGMSMGNTTTANSRPAFDTLNLFATNNNYASLSPLSINDKLSGYAPTRSSTVQNTYAAYFSDVINPIQELSIMLSGRIDRFINEGTTNLNNAQTAGQYNQTSFSPKVGITYQIIPTRIAIFGNYMNGFQNTAPVSQVDGTISVFKPQYGNQWEAGIKAYLADKLLDATISYYNIQISNVVRNDPKDATYYIQDGKQQSRGVEADIQSQPLLGLYLHAGISYNDSRYTIAGTSTEGLRPVNAGPKWLGNWYATYQFTKGNIEGLGFGIGGNYYDKNNIINSLTAGNFYTNAYTLINSQIHLERGKYVFAISVNNLTNKHYYFGGAGFITPGQLRQLILSLKIKF